MTNEIENFIRKVKKKCSLLTYFDRARDCTVNQPILPQGQKSALPLFPFL